MIISAVELADDIKKAVAEEVDLKQSVGFMLMAIEDKFLCLRNSISYFNNEGRSVTITLSDMADKFCPGFPYKGLPLEVGDALRDKLKDLGYEVALHKTEKTTLQPSRIFRVIVAIPASLLEEG